MIVKGNQPTLRADIRRLLERARGGAGVGTQRVQVVGESCGWPPLRSAYTSEVGHGRLERRTLRVVEVPVGLEWLAWPQRAQVFALHRATQDKKSGRTRYETVYGITSLKPQQADAATLLAMVRCHWRIENTSHWVRDVTFDEDRSCVRSGHSPQVLAAVRNTAIGLLRRSGAANIASACRACAAQPWKALQLIGIHRTE